MTPARHGINPTWLAAELTALGTDLPGAGRVPPEFSGQPEGPPIYPVTLQSTASSSTRR